MNTTQIKQVKNAIDAYKEKINICNKRTDLSEKLKKQYTAEYQKEINYLKRYIKELKKGGK